MVRKVICALDTADLGEAVAMTRKLAAHVGAFKVGHALTLPHGLDVLDRLRDAGARRIFLDLKFHDIPNSVALAVREATRRGVWMATLHIAGGPAMMTAAVEESRAEGDETAPMLVGVSVLTSLDQKTLTDHLGVQRTIEEQKAHLSRLAIECGLDGVVCAVPELKAVRAAIGHEGVIVAPGIRLPNQASHDQVRTGDPKQALADGADYLVLGRALTECEDVEERLASLDIDGAAAAGR